MSGVPLSWTADDNYTLSALTCDSPGYLSSDPGITGGTFPAEDSIKFMLLVMAAPAGTIPCQNIEIEKGQTLYWASGGSLVLYLQPALDVTTS